VAEAILHCSENPVRDIYVGAGGKAFSFFGKLAPRTADKVMEATMFDLQKTDKPADGNPKESLYESKDGSLRERGDYEGHVSESSLYTKASMHPIMTGAAALALGAGLAYTAIRRFNQNH
jgi:hypothetical protein